MIMIFSEALRILRAHPSDVPGLWGLLRAFAAVPARLGPQE